MIGVMLTRHSRSSLPGVPSWPKTPRRALFHCRIHAMAATQPPVVVPASSSGFIESIDPASGAVKARIEASNPNDVPVIFERALAAQKAWSARPLRERCALLQRLRDVILVSRDQIADVVIRETGKPRVEAVFAEILLALDTADSAASPAIQ